MGSEKTVLGCWAPSLEYSALAAPGSASQGLEMEEWLQNLMENAKWITFSM